MENLHHIVVVGGGAGGLELVTSLGNKLGKKGKARISLVDAGLTHVWKPLLHEVASGSLDAAMRGIRSVPPSRAASSRPDAPPSWKRKRSCIMCQYIMY